MTAVDKSEAGTRSGRAIGVAMVVGALLIGAYFASGMPGMDHSGSTVGEGGMASTDHESMPFMRLDPDAFAARLVRPSAFVINVHTPYAGELGGTDAFIPYERVVGDTRLPDDKDAEMVLYCRTGTMSRIAAEALTRAGYTNVVDLQGGMDTWEAVGRPVRANPL